MEYWTQKAKNNNLFNIFQDDKHVYFIEYNLKISGLEQIYTTINSFLFSNIGDNLEKFVKYLNIFIFLTDALPTEKEIKISLINSNFLSEL